jgi:hypothetical protein
MKVPIAAAAPMMAGPFSTTNFFILSRLRSTPLEEVTMSELLVTWEQIFVCFRSGFVAFLAGPMAPEQHL